MNLFSILLALVFAVGAFAQDSYINYPFDGFSIRRGRTVDVQVARPTPFENVIELVIVIAILSCPDRNCVDPDEELGKVLYIGKFRPRTFGDPSIPYQNFTVTMPDRFTADRGEALLTTTRFYLTGDGPTPEIEYNKVTVYLR